VSNLKVETEATLPPELVAAYDDFILQNLIAIQTAGLERYDFSRVSTHLTMLSKLVGMLQAIDAKGTVQLLQAMTDIAAERSPKATADYTAAHTRLLNSWELYFAQSSNGVPA
jgi:cytoplasmic iron level regulating protein YaaA (DUF328/UPF0246 family)